MAGILAAGGVTADYVAAHTLRAEHYQNLRNYWCEGNVEPIAPGHDIEFDFFLPSETEEIVSIKLNAMGLRFRAYATGASSGGGEYVTSEESGDHDHQLTSYTGLGTGGASLGVDGTTGETDGHTHPSGSIRVTPQSHNHSFIAVGHPMTMRGSHTHEIVIPDHTHSLVYGIFESTTPTNVVLYCDNGSGYGPGIPLNSAPDTMTPYTLATELNLTSYFSGPGWKRIRLTSSRLGRINYKLAFTIDIDTTQGGGTA
jgi:hypothetical protein